ncbi:MULTISPECIES: phage tail protein [Planotetraspora]|jgi:phage tail-like protein|uniref:Phage tail protein n=2 Tax=Planotetraspora TaxID=58120 RepID=A0A8J3UR76_9ACTN|nr:MULTISPECIES: phage tail protein [Planotetraspora]GII28162.1 phage tail protein [Planotetraspora mira]GII46889.1 phage tail protein [Planotetraspora silvatica]
MRGGLSGLGTAFPIGEALPSLYAEDGYTQRLTEALDEVLAPVFTTLDCLDSYLSPELAPEDLLEWLAGWVALSLDEHWTVRQRRAMIARAVTDSRARGTLHGLRDQLRLLTGTDLEVVDTGGCVWSDEPGAPLPGSVANQVLIKAPGLDPDRVRALAERMLPAHVRVVVDGGTAPADA